MKYKLNFSVVLIILFFGFANAQVGVGTTTPDASSILDVTSTTQGLLMPRLTTTNRNAIVLPAKGLMIFNTTANQIQVNTGTPAIPVWTALGSDPSGVLDEPWFNQATNTAATSNTQNIYQLGNVGIGTSLPSDKLQVFGGNMTVGGTGIGSLPNPGLSIHSNSNSADTGGFLGFLEVGAGNGYYMRHNTGDSASRRDGMWFERRVGANYFPVFGFDSFDRLGVGTTYPNQKLDVVGNIAFTGALMPNSSAGLAGQVLTSAGPGVAPTWATNSIFNIYNSNGTLTGNRIVTMGANNLSFIGAGNVGVGTTTPVSKLDVFNGTLNHIGIQLLNGDNNRSSCISIGKATEYSQIAACAAGEYFTDAASGDMAIKNFDSGKLLLGAGYAPVASMAILPGGNIGINTIAPTARLSVNGTANKPGGGAWATFCDARVKKNVINYTKGLNEILAIRPVSYQYNDKAAFDEDGKTYVGVIAQEIEKILPNTVEQIKTTEFDDLRQFDSSELTYTLINAIKELKLQSEIAIKKLKTESENAINELKSEIAELKKNVK